MRILHTSDLHLGAALNGVSLVQDQRLLMQQLIGTARDKQAEAVVIAGDVFDRAVVSADAIAVYNELMTALVAELRLPVFMVAGNHDGAARLSACGELLAGTGLHIAGSVRDGLKSVPYKDCVFHLLPYFSLEEARFLFPEEAIKTYEDAMGALIKMFYAAFDPTKKNILVSHCYVSGAEVTETDRSVMVGGANMVGVGLFEAFDYVALGHLHKPQEIGKNARYAGAPGKLSFSEAKEQKSFTVIDTDTMEREQAAVTPCREMRVVRGTLEETLAQARLERGAEDYIKVELSDEYAHMELLSIFREAYPNLLALTGKSYEGGEGQSLLSVEQIRGFSEMDIMLRFFEEYSNGERPSPSQTEWFCAAVRSVAEEGGQRQ